MNKKSQIQFTHRCAVLLEAGISLSETLFIIIRMEKSPKIAKIFSFIKDNVEKGVSLSKSISLSGAIFNSPLISMIAYGESSGILALSLRKAGEDMKNNDEMKKKMAGALVYPSFISLATIGMTLFLVMYIFPKIIPLLSSMDVDLPFLTRILKELYEYLLDYGMWTFFFLVVLFSLLCFLYKKKNIIRFKAQITILTLPIIGEIFKKYFLSHSFHSAGTLLEYGQSLPSILGQLSLSSTFEPYKKAWNICKSEVMKGVSLSQCMNSFQTLFPSMSINMISIGERTGNLSSMFSHIGSIYDEELEIFIKAFGVVIEPLLMICMGLVVGSVALSIILPIYAITNHLGQ